MIKNKRAMLRRASASACAVALVALVGCQDETPSGLGRIPVPDLSQVVLGLEASSLDAAVGSRISLGLSAEAPEGVRIGMVQGFLRYDPHALRYVGELTEDDDLVVLNSQRAEAGELRLLSLNPHGLQGRAASFAFEVIGANYREALSFESEGVAHLESNSELDSRFRRNVLLGSALPEPSAAREVTLGELAERLDPSLRSNGGPNFIISPPPPTVGAGQTVKYGDVNMNGNVDAFDALDVARTAVGANELIIGTGILDDGIQASDRDRITAANVAPANIGQPAPCQPGWQACDPNNRVVNGFDALPISRELVGVDDAIVGSDIPLAGTVSTGDTVFVPSQTIVGTRTFSRDSLYILNGVLTVGSETAGAGTLVVEPGTRVEGDTVSALYVTRRGQIFAEGTPNQPIVFTCTTANASNSRYPACWGGIFIAGNAVLNEAGAGLPAAPAIPGRNPGGGGNQRAGEGGAVNYGGNNDADNSGTLRYVSIRYGGKVLFEGNELNNLTVGACGTGTVLEHIQVHAGTDDGMEMFGGRCNVKYLYATANEDDQFDYSFGYDGDVQFLIIQGDPDNAVAFDRGFEVDNTETLATYNNTPRTNATLYNVTYVGNGNVAGRASIPVMQYRRGAGSTLRNVVAMRSYTGIEVDETASCALLGSDLTFQKFVFLDVTQTVGNSGGGCTDAQVTASLVDVENRAYANELSAPFSKTLPDFRPTAAGGVSAGFSPAAAPGGFFDPATYFGAVAPGGGIPWYAGWVTGWQSNTMR